MKCPNCKAENPFVRGWYSCLGIPYFAFDCCGEITDRKRFAKEIHKKIDELEKKIGDK